MDGNDRRAIEDLFGKLSGVERNAPPRDPEAEAFIRSALDRAPAAPYYMAQTIIVQQQALEAAERRIEELERDGGRDSEGFLSGLFGGGRARPPVRRDPRQLDRRRQDGPWNQPQGGGFLAGAAQTAMGVAGGILLGNMIAGAFSGGSANAAENDRNDDRSGNERNDDDRSDNNDSGGGDDGGSDFADAGDFGGGDF
jgi:hypothetical protein